MGDKRIVVYEFPYKAKRRPGILAHMPSSFDTSESPGNYFALCLTYTEAHNTEENVRLVLRRCIDSIYYLVPQAFKLAGCTSLYRQRLEHARDDIDDLTSTPLYPWNFIRKREIEKAGRVVEAITTSQEYNFYSGLLETEIPVRFEIVPEASELFSAAQEHDKPASPMDFREVNWDRVQDAIRQSYETYLQGLD